MAILRNCRKTFSCIFRRRLIVFAPWGSFCCSSFILLFYWQQQQHRAQPPQALKVQTYPPFVVNFTNERPPFRGNDQNTLIENEYKAPRPLVYSLEVPMRETSASFNDAERILTIKTFGIFSYRFQANGTKTRFYHTGKQPLFGCPYQNCFFTRDDNADVFLIEMMALDWGLEEPPPKLPNHRWVLFTMEPPPIMNATFWKHNAEYFEAVLSYRSDSVLQTPYGCTKKKQQPTVPDLEFVRGKTKLVAWFVSNCGGQSKRMRYYNELTKYIPVDVYGNCGNLTCPQWLKPEDGMHPCLRTMADDYKFYLAFENSICEDYVTEKIWSKMHLSVPIVLGGADYANLLPPHSYIDVSDFPSAHALAEYLKFLAENETMYLSYYAWQTDYEVQYACTVEVRWPCRICEYLNMVPSAPLKQSNDTKSVISRLSNQEASCTNADDFYSNFVEFGKWNNI